MDEFNLTIFSQSMLPSVLQNLLANSNVNLISEQKNWGEEKKFEYN